MRPPRGRLTVAAAQVCAPWYRIHQMAAKLLRELGRVELPADAIGTFQALVHAVNVAVDAAGVCVEAVERKATHADDA